MFKEDIELFEKYTENSEHGTVIKIHNIDGKEFEEKYGFPTPLGVKGRNSDNRLFRENIGWEPTQSLLSGMEKTYKWIEKQIRGNK